MDDNDTFVMVDVSIGSENRIYLRILLFVVVMCCSCLSVCLGSLTSLLIRINRAMPRLLEARLPSSQIIADIENAAASSNASVAREIAARACGDAIEMAMNGRTRQSLR